MIFFQFKILSVPDARPLPRNRFLAPIFELALTQISDPTPHLPLPTPPHCISHTAHPKLHTPYPKLSLLGNSPPKSSHRLANCHGPVSGWCRWTRTCTGGLVRAHRCASPRPCAAPHGNLRAFDTLQLGVSGGCGCSDGLTPSHPHTPTPSHPHTLTPSHRHTLTPCHPPSPPLSLSARWMRE